MGGTGDETDQKSSIIDLTGVNQSSRPTTTKSVGSSLRSDGKRVRLKAQRPTLFNFGNIVLKRDPFVEKIIESRKFSIIENPYTRLAQVTSQAPRLSQRTNAFEILSATVETEDENKDRISSPHNDIKFILSTTSQLDNEGWDDGLSIEYERGKIESIKN